MILFKYFQLLRFVSSRFWTGLGADHAVFHKNEICFIAARFIFLVFYVGTKSARRTAQTLRR